MSSMGGIFLYCLFLAFFLTLNGVCGPGSTALATSLEEEYSSRNLQSLQAQRKIPCPQPLLSSAMDLQKRGYLAQALVQLSAAYGEENILTDNYYSLVDRKRKAILTDIENGAPWAPGASNSKKTLQSFMARFETLDSAADILTHPFAGKFTKFPRERFINYRIIQTLQNNNAHDCLSSPDPWMVSNILFLARKREVKIQPQDVIRRWEGRPDLWDDVCEEQALLYLATFPADVISKLKIHNNDVRDVIQSHFKDKNQRIVSDCTYKFDGKSSVASMDMAIVETDPYESLKRVEISLRDKDGKEFFRAMNNRSSVCAPIPPNAFGVFPVGEKKQCSLKDVKSAGMGAGIPNQTKYGSLLPGCTTQTDQGVLTMHWAVKVDLGNIPGHKIYPFVKVVARGENDAPWNFCSSSTDNPQSALPAETSLATVTPLLCFEENGCREAERITLVRLSRQKRKGVIQRWAGDTAFAYEFREISREIVDIKKLPGHKIGVESGYYRFEYNDVRGNPPAGFYGKSEVFEVKGGGGMEIKVRVSSAL